MLTCDICDRELHVKGGIGWHLFIRDAICIACYGFINKTPIWKKALLEGMKAAVRQRHGQG